MNIPNFLIEMSGQLKEQDNRMTADPIFMVCYDKWLTCANGRGDKEIYLMSDGGDYNEFDTEDELFDHLKENHSEWCSELILSTGECEGDIESISEYVDIDDLEFSDSSRDFTVEKICMQKEMCVVNSHFTEYGAKRFIETNQHNYAKLYTYAFSMYRCHQMKELRQWIISLTDKEQ